MSNDLRRLLHWLGWSSASVLVFFLVSDTGMLQHFPEQSALWSRLAFLVVYYCLHPIGVLAAANALVLVAPLGSRVKVRLLGAFLCCWLVYALSSHAAARPGGALFVLAGLLALLTPAFLVWLLAPYAGARPTGRAPS